MRLLWSGHPGKALRRHPVRAEERVPAAVILFSDGWPSDDYREPLERLLSSPWGERTARAAIAIGQDADCGILEEFTSTGGRVFRNEALPSLKAEMLTTFHAVMEAALSGRELPAPGPEPEDSPKPPPELEPLPSLRELLGEGTLAIAPPPASG